jgi:hypothetical protein
VLMPTHGRDARATTTAVAASAALRFLVSHLEHIGDERFLDSAIFEWILNAHRENSALPLLVAAAQFRTGAERLPKPYQLALFIRTERNDMSVNPEWAAGVLDTAHAHGPTLGKRLRPALLLKSQFVQNGPGACEQTLWIQDHQINDALSATTWHRRAPHMLDLQLRLDTSDGAAEQARRLDNLWLVRPKLSGHQKIRKQAEHTVFLT